MGVDKERLEPVTEQYIHYDHKKATAIKPLTPSKSGVPQPSPDTNTKGKGNDLK